MNPKDSDDIESLLAALSQAFLKKYGQVVEEFEARFLGGRRFLAPVPRVDAAATEAKDTDKVPWAATAFQIAILEALESKALRTDALAAALDCDRRTLYKKGGLKELMEKRKVLNHPRVGYYRPDAPPEELEEDE